MNIVLKEPSPFLVQLMKDAAANLADFAASWSEIIDRGKEQDFTEQELKEMFVPYLKEQLEKLGIDKEKIADKVYYMMNTQKKAIANKAAYEKRRINPINDYNNDIEDCSIPGDWNRESSLDEIGRLHTKIAEQEEKIKELQDALDNVGFNENPDIFEINKRAINDGQQYYERVSLVELQTLVKSYVKPGEHWEFAMRRLS